MPAIAVTPTGVPCVDTVHHVPGRGGFHTGADGKVTYVQSGWGVNGARNPDLIHPGADATYVVNQPVDAGSVLHTDTDVTHVFQTDAHARTIMAHAEDYRPRRHGPPRPWPTSAEPPTQLAACDGDMGCERVRGQ